MSDLKDGGSRKVYSTGAMKEDTGKTPGKGAYHLLPPHPIRRVAEIYRRGAERYASRNWEKGVNISRYVDSGLRHFFQFIEGMEDEDHLHQCFPSGTIISGPIAKEIQDIEVGHFVYGDIDTEENSIYKNHFRLQKVTHVFENKHCGELIRIQANGIMDIIVTPDHPILCVYQTVERNKTKAKHYANPEWVKAKDIISDRIYGHIEGHCLLIPRWQKD